MSANDIYDTLVVGAGLTGALVAHHLAEASLNVVVLEAKEAPGGVAGKGAGLALLGTPESYATLQERLGPDTARRIWELTHKNLNLLTATINKMEQDATQTGSIRIADSDSESDTLQQSITLLKQDSYTVDLNEPTEPASLRGIKTIDDLSFDPAALTAALLNHPNITVECEAEVQSIKPRAGQPGGDTPLLTVWARKHYIWTKNVVLANSAYAIRLNRSLGDVISPLAMHAVDLRTEIALPTPWVLKNGEVIVQALDEHTWRMVGWTGDNKDVLAQLTEVAEQLCPGVPVTARHTWWVAQSQDGLPIVGQLPDTPNVYVVNGLGPWGLSWAFIAADRLVSLLIHGEDPALLGVDRFFAQ